MIEWIQKTSHIVVRAAGMIVLLFGMIAVYKVFDEALTLYHDPAHIDWLAQEIEKRSNLDKNIIPAAKRSGKPKPRPPEEAGEDMLGDGTEEGGRGADAPDPNLDPSKDNLRLSYFFAWIIELSLLLLIGRIGIAAVRTGGELALYDHRIKQLLKAFLNQSK